MKHLLMLASAAALLSTAPAYAKPDHAKGHKGHHAKGHAGYGAGGCPPGLAKKNNGCLPPGQAKKRYAIGRPLPRDVVVVAVPPYLPGRLPPVERGYRYGMVDGDLVKLAIGTSLVVDAMNGLLD